MTILELNDQIVEKFLEIPEVKDFLNERIIIRADSAPENTLMPWNYIPSHCKKGEYRVLCYFRDSRGEAYTETPESFDGALKEAIELPASEKGIDARMLAAINAVMNHLGLCAGTHSATFDDQWHYTDAVYNKVAEQFGQSNIILVGYNGYFVKKFVEMGLDFWTMDRDPDNVSQDRFKHVVVNSGYYNREACFAWGKHFLITGSTLTNGTIVQYIDRAPDILFYGITIAGAATLLKLPWIPVKRLPYSGA